MLTGTSVATAEKTPQQVRVILAIDLVLMRQGISWVLNAFEDIKVIGEADSADEAIRVALELKPNVVLMDQELGEEDGLGATRMIKQAMPQIEVIVMTDHLDDAKALEAIEAGATGYILKDIPGANLATAVRSVCHGRAFFHPEITRKLMERLGRLARERRGAQRSETGGLTPRELDILAEVAKGRTDQEIATRFVVAEGTVKTHIRHILRKLPARNRAQAVAYVLRKGLIK
ncbi:MAG TPA: response regulator transcription factor [bacterium]|nr:response regulator transcription factor [bacterium]